MTREEQIEQAAREYATHYIDTKETDFYGKFIQEMGCNREEERAFIAGARWAVANPKSPWISIDDDLPCNHSDLVLTYNDIPFSTKRVMVVTDIHTLFLCEMKKDDDRGWIWNYPTKDKITHWFPIPEPPKE